MSLHRDNIRDGRHGGAQRPPCHPRLTASLLAACLLVAGLGADGCSPRRGSTGQKATPIDYQAIKDQSGPMIERVIRHANALAGFGPRQTGQAGCDKSLAYIRKVLAEAAPGLEIKELATTVTVPLDRIDEGSLDSTDGHTHLVLHSGGGSEELLAYSLMPNCAQACQTHPIGSCGSTASLPPSGPSQCDNCERPRPMIDLKDGAWDDFNGKDVSGKVVLLDFNSSDAWLRAASLGAYGAILVEPDDTTVFQADKKYLASLPLHFPRLYVKKAQAQRLRDALAADRATAGSAPTSEPARVTLVNRLAWKNVTARGLELTIPGKDRSYCFVLAAHFDARSIVPDLSYGAAEVWGVSELLELVRRYASSDAKPNCDLRILFVSGHWQQQQLMRDYLAIGGPNLMLIGKYIRLAMGIDMVPQGTGLNMISESAWDINSQRAYNWFDMNFFGETGWRQQILDGLGLMRTVPPSSGSGPPTKAPAVEVFAGVRPILTDTRDDKMADRNNLSPLMYAPRYTTAEEAWQSVKLPTFAFQTGRLTRLLHNTPLDRMERVVAEARIYAAPGQLDAAKATVGAAGQDDAADKVIADQLSPQLQVTMATLEQLMQYPAANLPDVVPVPRTGRRLGEGPTGGYTRISGRVFLWDRSIGWFAQRLPGSTASSAISASPKAEPPSGAPTVAGAATQPASSGSPMQTFIHAFPNDLYVNHAVSPLGDKRQRNFRPWAMIPSTGQTRELQCFSFQDLRLLDRADFRLNTIYAAFPETQYNVVGYGIDPAGRLCYATDYGIHGDGNKAFQCTEVLIDSKDVSIPVSLFECGTMELFDLIDFQRYNPLNETPAGAWLYSNQGPPQGPRSLYVEFGIAPYLRVQGVKDIRSHTEIERWGYTQYASTAMVFLPAKTAPPAPAAQQAAGPATTPAAATAPAPAFASASGRASSVAAEVLLGGYFTNFAILNNPDDSGQPQGYSLPGGQSLRMAGTSNSTAAQCVRQLGILDSTRINHFAQYDVASPLAARYNKESTAAVAAADEARDKGDWQTARAEDLRSWVLESGTYRATLSLLLDVVSTTVLYFVLLIPFSFLIERLIFPQRTTLKTVLVSSAVFAVFACILYMFHPGFKLASNIMVITISFIIVVMTVPALILLLVRGVAMLRAIGSNAVITQRSEAESAGVVTASLSLAVSNMRRRRLRTALTLSTITILVMALVLLTTSSAFDFRILEPTGMGRPSFEGIQIYNTLDRRRPLIPEMVEVYERILRQEHAPGQEPSVVIRREFINYGYDYRNENGCLYLTAGQRRARLPYFQVMDEADDLIEYTAPTSYALWRRSGSEAASAEADKETIHLSDLVEGRFLQSGDVDVCLLPNTMAKELGVKLGDTVRVMGLPLTVIGTWMAQITIQQDGRDIPIKGPLDDLMDQDGLPITALRQSAFRSSQQDSPQHAPSTELIIVPRAWVRKYGIFPTSVESLIVAAPQGAQGQSDPTQVFDQAQRLAREILNVDVFSYFKDPQTQKGTAQRLSMRTATQVKGSGMMMIVLAVAVLMILAIMTGTVYERMKEIHIFSSVGLSPRHIAGMFFVEAMVFAGIAAVLGYFLGVIALKGLLAYLKSSGQKVDFYPNYLGVFVLYSIGVAVLATLLSSIYPIRLASRIVNPSQGKTWQFSEGMAEDLVNIKLPFIATTWTEACGMMVYAYDFLAIHQGERSGRFVCEKPPRGSADGQSLRLEMPIWLAPFERNLSQETVLSARPTSDGAWWELWLDLRRLSGEHYLWKRGATVFVNMLCKHLLRWRAVSPEMEAQSAARADSVCPGGSDVRD